MSLGWLAGNDAINMLLIVIKAWRDRKTFKDTMFIEVEEETCEVNGRICASFALEVSKEFLWVFMLKVREVSHVIFCVCSIFYSVLS
jgi:hypothetical protein